MSTCKERRAAGILVSPIGWALMTDPLEILPFNDTHKHSAGITCWCRPIENDDDVIVHNAADRREDYIERGRKMN